LGSDGNGVRLGNWGRDLNVVHNLLNVDLGRVLDGHLLGDLRVSTNGGLDLLSGDVRLIKRSNVSAESGLQDLRGIAGNDGSVFVVDLGVDDLGSSVVHNSLDRCRGDMGVLHNWGGNFNSLGHGIAKSGRGSDGTDGTVVQTEITDGCVTKRVSIVKGANSAVSHSRCNSARLANHVEGGSAHGGRQEGNNNLKNKFKTN